MGIRPSLGVAAFLWTALAGGSGQFTESELQSAVISMTREDRCGFGQQDPTDIRQCPDYSISLSGDGTVQYEGRNGVRTLGKQTHQTSAKAVHDLVVEFEKSGFFSLNNRYEQVQVRGLIQTIDHAIATTVSISVAGRTKRVYDFYGTPEVLTRLERRIDEVSDSRRYTGRPPQVQDLKPEIAPFHLEGGGATFLIKTKNTRSNTLKVNADGLCRMRLDGTPESELAGGSGGVLDVAPGETWQELVTLVTWPRKPTGRRPANPQRDTVWAYREVQVRLTSGWHAIDFRCGGEWSDKTSFIWTEGWE